jgi:hypothetical protein
VLVEFPGANLQTPRKLAGTISENAGKRLVILSPEKISASASIRVQGKHLLFLGDVLESTLDADGQWSVHVHVKSKFMIF